MRHLGGRQNRSSDWFNGKSCWRTARSCSRSTAPAREWLAAKGWDPAYGARPLKRVIQRNVQDPLAEMILAGEVKDGDRVAHLGRGQRADLQRQGAADRGDRAVRGAGAETEAELKRSAERKRRSCSAAPPRVDLATDRTSGQ